MDGLFDKYSKFTWFVKDIFEDYYNESDLELFDEKIVSEKVFSLLSLDKNGDLKVYQEAIIKLLPLPIIFSTDEKIRESILKMVEKDAKRLMDICLN